MSVLAGPPHLEAMSKAALFLTLIIVLTSCSGGAPMTACPDPDPNPISPCATSHSHTYGGGG